MGGLLVASSLTCAAAEREMLSLGQRAPDEKLLQQFLFPEAECENATYQCMAVRPSTERSVGMDIRFHTGSADLTPEAKAQLDTVGKVLASRRGKLNAGEILIEGHADARGSAEYNKKLSEQRAQSVVKHLVSTHSVDRQVLVPVGRGKEYLRDQARPDSEVNRRVEFVRKPK
jgi:outer membrane protein OmpA-like peptidoglycan-associated protein